MAKPILCAEDCARIHAASFDVLESVGVRVDDAAIVGLLKRHGARDGATADTVRIPRELVRECLETCPRSARFSDRRGGMSDLGAGGASVFWTGNALYVAHGKTRRELLASDLALLSRVADACPEIDGMVGTSVADFPPPAISRASTPMIRGSSSRLLRSNSVQHGSWVSISTRKRSPRLKTTLRSTT